MMNGADPVARILAHAETLREIAKHLPEKCDALALILTLMGDDIHQCGEALDGKLPPTPRRSAAAAPRDA